MKIFITLFFFFFLFVSLPAFSQDNASEAKTEKKNDVESRKIKRKKDKAAWKAKRQKDRGDRHAIKSHEKRLQTKETRKRMKKNRRTKSSPYGRNNKSTWWYRLWH